MEAPSESSRNASPRRTNTQLTQRAGKSLIAIDEQTPDMSPPPLVDCPSFLVLPNLPEDEKFGACVPPPTAEERKAGTMDSIDDPLRPSSTGLDFSDEEEIGAWIWNFSRNARLGRMVRDMERGRFFLNEVHMHHVDCNDKRITGLVMSLRSIASQFLRQRILPLR